MRDELLVRYPYVLIRIRCDFCSRAGSYRLARLAAKYGPEIRLDDLLSRLTVDCPFANPRHPYKNQCKARYSDLEPPRRPPDMPAGQLRVVAGGKR
jgi:hypothetical protein